MTAHAPARHAVALHDGWVVSAVGGPVPAGTVAERVPATVPGTVHTDLLGAGLIPDPYLDDNEALLKWVGQCDWEYRTTFAWSADGSDGAAAGGGHDRHDLVFDGLDTVATIVLNGAEVARTANMHRTYRFDVAALLREGDNELVVRFASPVREADARSLALGYRPQVNHHPFNAIRKAAYNYGWDWGIDAATAGIWRPVRLESWSTARLASVRPSATADVARGVGLLDVHVRVDDATSRPHDGGALDVVVRVVGNGSDVLGTAAVAEGAADLHLEVTDAALWWPRGYGDQPLYDVEVELRRDGAVLDTWRSRTGFRSVRLDLEPDEHGTSFSFVVNDRPVWVKGANWIPDDEFLPRVTRQRYAARLDQAERANLNLLRVWGGGVYESDDFYELCDERGILTWQDFAFACAAYSEEEPLRSEVEAEARDNVTRLAPHPSLVLWNGSNENIWGHQTWGWIRRLEGKSWGLGYYTDLLPGVVSELDGTRPYTPSSPWSGTLDRFPNDPDHGSMHSWELWNRDDWAHYRDTVPRFMAEFGWQGPPTWSTLARSISDEPMTPQSPGMQVHQKAMGGNDKLTDGLLAHLPLPDDMDDWHWAMSWNQAVAIRTAVEHLRSWAPRCTGSVVWQLNDCWPVTSWAAVDGDGHDKPLLHALAQAHADRLVTVQPRSLDGGEPRRDGGDVLAVVVANDTDEEWAGELEARRVAFDGVELESVKVPVRAPSRGAATVLLPTAVGTPRDDATELVVAALDGVRGLWFFAEPRHSELAADPFVVDARSAPGGATLTVTASHLVRDLTVLADKVHPDARVDAMLVTLLPGERAELHVSVPEGVALDPAAFTAPHVLRSLNQLAQVGR